MRELIRPTTRPLAAAILAVAGLLCGVPAANAQEAQPPAPGLSEPSPSIPDHKLDAAAAALERVANLSQTYQEQIAAAAPSDKERIADEAKTAFVQAVTDQGLSVEEYTSILRTAQADPEVRQKIIQRLDPSSK